MKCKFKLLTLILFFSIYLNAQKPFKEEVCWSIWHPIAALKVKKIHSKVLPVYKQTSNKLVLDSFSNGGKLDAFRHTFFMAAFAQKIKPKKVNKLGITHEKGNYRQFLKHQNENGESPDSLGTVMDLNNNALGIKIGSANKKLSINELKEEVINQINLGKALIIKRNKLGLYVDCDDKLVDLKLYANKWFVPKCLVPSN